MRSAFLVLELLLRSELGFVLWTKPVRNLRFAQQRRYLGLRRKTQPVRTELQSSAFESGGFCFGAATIYNYEKSDIIYYIKKKQKSLPREEF